MSFSTESIFKKISRMTPTCVFYARYARKNTLLPREEAIFASRTKFYPHYPQLYPQPPK